MYGTRTYSTHFNDSFIAYLNDYIDYCNSIGVQVLFTTYPTLDEAVRSTDVEIIASDKAFSKVIKAPFISNSLDYIYPREYIYDYIAHCNSAGAIKRTKQLYNDLKDYLKR
jgi:hypothetical protein